VEERGESSKASISASGLCARFKKEHRKKISGGKQRGIIRKLPKDFLKGLLGPVARIGKGFMRGKRTAERRNGHYSKARRKTGGSRGIEPGYTPGSRAPRQEASGILEKRGTRDA